MFDKAGAQDRLEGNQQGGFPDGKDDDVVKLCVLCGEPIPPKRLLILPGTKTCVSCSSESKKSIRDMPGSAIVQHTGGLHEKYLKEEDI